MQITVEHIKKDSKKKIGTVGDSPVFSLMTLGGLNMICLMKNSVPKVLAIAPHIAIAKYIAKQIEPDLVIEELSKSEDLPLAMFQHLVPQWSDITKQVVNMLG